MRTTQQKLLLLLGGMMAVAPSVLAAVSVKSEQLNPASPAWKFQTINRNLIRVIRVIR